MARLGPDRKGDRKVRDDGIGLLLGRSHHIVHGQLALANLSDVLQRDLHPSLPPSDK